MSRNLVSDQVQRFPLGCFKPSPTNPRKRFNPTKLAELAASITKHKVLQPVTSRPNPEFVEGNGQPPLELVAGERRWRASEIAGEPELPTLVKDLSDLEVLEIQLVENIERDDLHPLEEAAGIHNLMEASRKAGKPLNTEDMGLKLGKSPRWVALRLELLRLCDEAREAFLADTINASVAGLIARMPNLDQQREATARILTGFNGEPFTFRAAADYLRKEFMLDLARATFNIDAAYRVAGPCHRCDKRSGSKPDLFDDVKTGDLCQDSKCFAAKGEEAHERLLQACRDAGHQVLQGDNARRLMPSSATPSGYFLAKDPCVTLTADKRSLFDLFGDKQKGFITVELTGSRSLVTLVPEDIARKLLKAKKLLRAAAPAEAPTPEAAPASAPAPAPVAQAPQAPKPAAKPVPLSPAQLRGAIDQRAGELFSRQLFMKLCAALRAAEELPLVILRCKIADDLIGASYESLQLVGQQFADMPEGTPAIRAWLSTLDGRQLGELMAVAAIAEELSNDDGLADLTFYSTNAAPLADAFGIDLHALQDAVDEVAAEEVTDAEDRRLGKVSAGDAFAAAQAETSHA